MSFTIGPAELLCLFFASPFIIAAAILWGARMIAKRKDGD